MREGRGERENSELYYSRIIYSRDFITRERFYYERDRERERESKDAYLIVESIEFIMCKFHLDLLLLLEKEKRLQIHLQAAYWFRL